MNDTLSLVVALVAGGVLGAVFFGGLWWTVRNGLSSRRPALWFFVSMVVRMSIVMAGFFVVGREDWKRLVACLVGFVIARLLVTWLTRSSGQRRPHTKQEARHAPQP